MKGVIACDTPAGHSCEAFHAGGDGLYYTDRQFAGNVTGHWSTGKACSLPLAHTSQECRWMGTWLFIACMYPISKLHTCLVSCDYTPSLLDSELLNMQQCWNQ